MVECKNVVLRDAWATGWDLPDLLGLMIWVGGLAVDKISKMGLVGKKNRNGKLISYRNVFLTQKIDSRMEDSQIEENIMGLKIINVYALECDWCGQRMPDNDLELVGWPTLGDIDDELENSDEWWGVTADGRYCCGGCVDTFGTLCFSPDGLPLQQLTHVERGDIKPQ